MSTTIQRRMSIVLIIALIATLIPMVGMIAAKPATAGTPINQTMVQYFEWYVPNDGNHWNRVAERAPELANMGVSALWLPPAYKGAFWGDTGYGVYDMYDLGEFDTAKLGNTSYPAYSTLSAKDKIRTKYGTRAEHDAALAALHANGIAAYADSVMNHKILGTYPNGDNALETVNLAGRCDLWGNRYNCDQGGQITTFTKAVFPARAGKYNTWTITQYWANGTDWKCDSNGNNCGNVKKNDNTTNAAALFSGRTWNTPIDGEFTNFDYLMGSNMDFSQSFVMDYHTDWSKWILSDVGYDGFRIDAVKHIKFDAIANKAGTGIIDRTRKAVGKNFFAVGEYWNPDLGSLVNYLNAVDYRISLFDVPMHYKFFGVGKGGFDLRNLNSGNLANVNYGMNAVTFVENHDTQYGQMLLSPVADWAKPMGYAYILTRQEGLPMLFYADMYGYEYRPSGSSQGTLGSKEGVKGNLYDTIKKLMVARTASAYGKQNDYFDDSDVVGFSREGVSDIANSGSATVLCDAWACGSPTAPSTSLGKWMFMGASNGGKQFKNVLGSNVVTVSGNGWAFFPAAGNTAVYINSAVNAAIPAPAYVAPGAVATAAPTATPAPTAAPTPVPVMAAATPTPAPLAILTNQTVELYYKKTGWTKANIHFRNTKDLVWTVAPGQAMSLDSTTGYYKATMTIPDGSQLEAVFNNGSSWDNNNNLNYKFNGNSVVSVTDGKVTAGAPASLATTTTTTTVTVTPTPVPAPTATPAPVSATTVSISFSLTGATTGFGDNINVAGTFNNWSTSTVKLSCSWASTTGCTWTGKVTAAANTTHKFKFVKVASNGAATWESIADRVVTVSNTNPALITAVWNK